jgi:hypothetical protein
VAFVTLAGAGFARAAGDPAAAPPVPARAADTSDGGDASDGGGTSPGETADDAGPAVPSTPPATDLPTPSPMQVTVAPPPAQDGLDTPDGQRGTGDGQGPAGRRPDGRPTAPEPTTADTPGDGTQAPPPVPVPDLYWMPCAQAEQELRDADLLVRRTGELDGAVMDQNPPAGTEVPPGSPVQITCAGIG